MHQSDIQELKQNVLAVTAVLQYIMHSYNMDVMILFGSNNM
jgi:hypothetical protein